MAKDNFTMRMDPEVKFYGNQLANLQHRTFSNLIELLLIKEIEAARAKGVIFIKFTPEGGEVVGKGPDERLKEQFAKFAGDDE